jgi:hypothetical protein
MFDIFCDPTHNYARAGQFWPSVRIGIPINLPSERTVRSRKLEDGL